MEGFWSKNPAGFSQNPMATGARGGGSGCIWGSWGNGWAPRETKRAQSCPGFAEGSMVLKDDGSDRHTVDLSPSIDFAGGGRSIRWHYKTNGKKSWKQERRDMGSVVACTPPPGRGHDGPVLGAGDMGVAEGVPHDDVPVKHQRCFGPNCLRHLMP